MRGRAASPRIARDGVPAAALVALVLALLAPACAGRGRTPGGTVPRPGGPAERGLASWYGPGFHGKTTASGERYNMMAFTAAHRALPFGTWVSVTNEVNGRVLVLRINDRGPFVRGRIVDVSYAAAKVLGMTGDGVVRVSLRVLPPGEGERIHAIQKRLISDGGIRTWSERDYRALEAAVKIR